MNDIRYMHLALELAKKGAGKVNPNPMVGALLVRQGQIIGQGFHREYGGPHAEQEAFDACSSSPEGADLYVTLEPCCHHGKRPPCTDRILKSGVRRVIIGSLDPNPLVAGKGIQILREQGIEVVTGVLEEECRKLNEIFFHFILRRRPYVVLKYAMSLDGKIACASGASRWITGEAAREKVHRDRNRFASIMVGIGTVLADDPLLTCRTPGGRDPLRIICDSSLRLPLSSRIVRSAKEVPTLLATCSNREEKLRPYLAAGIRVLQTPPKEGTVDLAFLMSALAEQNIDSVLLEGGSELHWAALESGIVQKIQTYIAPKILGGREATSPVGGRGVPCPDAAFHLSAPKIRVLGEDILLESEVLSCSQESSKKSEPSSA